MALIAGVDGCKKGWICVFKDTVTGNITSKVYPNAKSLLEQQSEVDVIAVDIPIGLPKDCQRICDTQAKKLLGSRHVTVFHVPVSAAIRADSWKEANLIQRKMCNRGLSQQAFGICPKIREFDELLSEQPSLQSRIKEVHPEVSFCAWNGNQPINFKKKDKEGLSTRSKLAANYFGAAVIEEVLSQYLRKDVASDDIHDAFAALWTAERIFKGKANRIPQNPPCDENGLYMEIWY